MDDRPRSFRDPAVLEARLGRLDEPRPHPSPTNVNTRPGARDRIVKVWRDASVSTLYAS